MCTAWLTIAGHNDGSFGGGDELIHSRPESSLFLKENVHLQQAQGTHPEHHGT